MKKLIPAVLIAAGAVGAGLAWRAATEESRRYSELLEVVRANEKGDGGTWSERDAARLWNHLLWFLDGRPLELTRRILESIEQGDRAAEAARLAVGMLESRRDAGSSRIRRIGDILPDHLLPADRGWDATLCRLPEVILASPRAVGVLADGARAEEPEALVGLVSALRDPPPHVWEPLRRVARRNTGVDARLGALQLISRSEVFRESRPVLVLLTADSDRLVRLAAMAELAQQGDAQMAREVLLLCRDGIRPLVPESARDALLRLLSSLGNGRRLMDLVYGLTKEANHQRPAQVWELTERLGNVLERRAVGEPDLLE